MAASPNITPRPSISEPFGDLSTPQASPLSARRDLEVASPVITPVQNSSKGLPTSLKPIGIINEQNTCFLNSTFQALSATRPLISLLTSSEASSLIPGSALPRPIFPPSLVPALQPDALEPPLFDLLPVTRAFINNLHKAWKLKDGGGGTYGSGETASGKCMSLRTLLREIASKYDQYDDYRQQDAHELLRHLLDSMEMEEKDIIKRLQPEQLRIPPRRRSSASNKKGKRDLIGISPMASPLPSPMPSQPSSPVKQQFDPLARAPNIGGQQQQMEQEERELTDSERLVPFVDVLFGGSLASVVVCEKCKAVNHTYEGFLDISLSMKDEPRTRKRDKLKALFRPKSNVTKPTIAETNSHSTAAVSETEMSDSERQPVKSGKDRRKSMDHDDRRSDSGSALSRNSSIKTSFGLKHKPSFSFGKKKKEDLNQAHGRPGSSSSSQSQVAPPDIEKASVAESTRSTVPGSPGGGGWKHAHGPGPTPAQSAYIQRILANQANVENIDPLAKLRAANNGEGLAVNGTSPTSEYGLIDCLKQFTSVEVLEGENSFACKKCWKIKSGRYDLEREHEPTVKEEDEDGEGKDEGSSPFDTSNLLSKRRVTAPSISIMSDTSSESHVTSIDDRTSYRHPSIASHASANIRAPSPLRRQIPDISTSPNNTHHSLPVDAISLSSSSRHTDSVTQESGADGDIEPDPEILDDETAEDVSDGLSDTSDESDVAFDRSPQLPVGRPRMAPRRKSTHFVHRRAFKRYLIAKAPEVLVLHLKRFRQTQKTSLIMTSFYDLKKVDDYVSFPETLDLAPFLAPNRNDYRMTQISSGPKAPYMDWASVEQGPDLTPVLYRLYAVVVHLGTMIGGHYIAYTLVDPEKMFEEGQKVVEAMRDMRINGDKEELPRSADVGAGKRVWCYCSDTSIRLASVDEVLKAKAYLCFYEKV